MRKIVLIFICLVASASAFCQDITSWGKLVLPDSHNFYYPPSTKAEQSFNTKVTGYLPGISVKWIDPIEKNVDSVALKNKFASSKTRIFVRNQNPDCGAEIPHIVESKLSMMGYDVQSYNSINYPYDNAALSKQGVDIVIEVSGLHFSDPKLFRRGVLTGLSMGKSIVTTRADFYHFKKAENVSKLNSLLSQGNICLAEAAEKCKATKNDWGGTNLNTIEFPINVDYQLIAQQIDREVSQSSGFINRNVISAVFLLIDPRSNKTLGVYNIGMFQSNTYKSEEIPFDLDYFDAGSRFGGGDHTLRIFKLPSNSGGTGYAYHIRTTECEWYTPYHKSMKDEIRNVSIHPMAYLSLIYHSYMANIEEVPYADKLNAGEDVKLSDRTIIENHTTDYSSTTDSYASSRTNYYRYFNKTYWDGDSYKKATSNSHSQTVFKDAEFLRIKDFNGYYSPLSDKLINELVLLRM